MPEDAFITSKQLADKLLLSHSHTRQLLRKGKIPGAVKVGRDWLIIDSISSEEEAIEAEDLPNTKAVAKALKFSPSYMRQLIREGKMKGVKKGRDWIVQDLEQIPYERQRKIKRKRK